MEEGVVARALNYHWPPGSWALLSIPQLLRIYAVEHRLADAQRPEGGPVMIGPDTGSDAADDDG